MVFELGFKGGLTNACVKEKNIVTMPLMVALKNWNESFLCKK
jgi:hypothetical protein